jgi:hypothetical protein
MRRAQAMSAYLSTSREAVAADVWTEVSIFAAGTGISVGEID